MAQFRYKLISKADRLDKDIIKNIFNNFGTDIESWDCPKYYIYVIYHKKDWIGYGCIRSHYSDGIHNVCYLGPTYIKNYMRGQKLQSKLIRKRLRLAKKLGYTKAISSTFYHNYPSNNSLIRCGFKMVCPWAQQEQDSIYWEKILS